MMPTGREPDGCSFAPDTILGVDLTPACNDHDISDLALDAHFALAAAILAAFVAAWGKRSKLARCASYVIGGAIGAVYGCGTTLWWLVRHRIWGRRRG